MNNNEELDLDLDLTLEEVKKTTPENKESEINIGKKVPKVEVRIEERKEKPTSKKKKLLKIIIPSVLGAGVVGGGIAGIILTQKWEPKEKEDIEINSKDLTIDAWTEKAEVELTFNVDADEDKFNIEIIPTQGEQKIRELYIEQTANEGSSKIEGAIITNKKAKLNIMFANITPEDEPPINQNFSLKIDFKSNGEEKQKTIEGGSVKYATYIVGLTELDKDTSSSLYFKLPGGVEPVNLEPEITYVCTANLLRGSGYDYSTPWDEFDFKLNNEKINIKNKIKEIKIKTEKGWVNNFEIKDDCVRLKTGLDGDDGEVRFGIVFTERITVDELRFGAIK